eukprot:CAMPEP_0117052450 /NCGR_PEP_ID=MMETSP0472-20121206/36258_1 /TAXON_ID=693140 ORGANISM="Tiarina fusus, Strain LIS" /NCGR_SAMPLE_ID=MMETSP0472 /ASSEMBLY_ACC=CAM_ASM_000603 /LENGTH=206 /DNA_ID=CAMNT_0004767087 /DNA_START=66 /DNA_END=683 /DNA_ORIENTATION=+
MKLLLVFSSALLVAAASGFTGNALPNGRSSVTARHAYIPDGFTTESYKRFKEQEAKKKARAKNLGGVGPRGFKSRSFQSFQEALERGEAAHLMPVENAAARIKSGELKPEDIPYMQRGGSWDNTDVRGARKVRWSRSDKEYASGGYRKEQSVSIFGKGDGLDWTGSRARSAPESVPGRAPKFAKNYKAPKVSDLKGGEAPKKKFFG